MPKPDVSTERKAQILGAARQVILKKGLDAARMEDIADAAGLSIGGLYWYYKTKDEVIFDLMDKIVTSDLQDLHNMLAGPGYVVGRFRNYIQLSVPLSQELSPLYSDFYALAGRNAAAQERLKEYFRAYRQILADLLGQGIAQGEFRSFDPRQVATLFAALYEGMLELAMIDPENVQPIPELLAALDHIFQGLHP